MHTISFQDRQKDAQISWRKEHITSQQNGFQNGKAYAHIIPRQLWAETLWDGIRKDLPLYMTDNKIQAHTAPIIFLAPGLSVRISTGNVK